MSEQTANEKATIPVDSATSADSQPAAAPNGDPQIQIIQVVVKLPNGVSLNLQLQPQDTLVEISQYLSDLPTTCYFTSFTLRYGDLVLREGLPLSDIPDLTSPAELLLVEEPYTERLARIHVARFRSILEGGQIYYDPFSDLASPAVVPHIPETLPTDDAADKGTNEVVIPHAFVNFPSTTKTVLENLYPKEFPIVLPRCIRNLTYTSWNPPPRSRAMQGDLFYLLLETLNREQYYLTCTPLGFYVNKSSANRFDPTISSSKPIRATTLVGLLEQLDPGFPEAFKSLQTLIETTLHPFATLPCPQPVYPWAMPSIDLQAPSNTRSESWLHQSLDSIEVPGVQRDWNDEFQQFRQLPRGSIEDPIVRDRALYRVHAEFVHAATAGAVAIVKGNVLPLNPLDPPAAQMFVYNNIFFSFAYDSRESFTHLGGDAAAHYAAAKDLTAVSAFEGMDIPDLSTILTVVIDYAGHRLTAQSIIPGILQQQKQDSAIIYGTADNGGKFAYDETFSNLLEKAAAALHIQKHTVTDDTGASYEIHSSIDCKGILGTDGRRYVIDLFRTTPLDVNFLESSPTYGLVAAPSSTQKEEEQQTEPKKDTETKQQQTEEGKEEVKPGPTIVSNPDVISKEGFGRALSFQGVSDLPPYPHKLPLIRLELLSAYYEHLYLNFLRSKFEQKKKDLEEKKATDQKLEDLVDLESPEFHFDVKFNPDMFVTNRSTPKGVSNSPDAKHVIDLSHFIIDAIILAFVDDIRTYTIVPMDSSNLTTLLHVRGINMRYLGYLARVLIKEIPTGEYAQPMLEAQKVVLNLVEEEMILRAAKHLLRFQLRSVSSLHLATCIAHFLNCFLSLQQVDRLQEETSTSSVSSPALSSLSSPPPPSSTSSSSSSSTTSSSKSSKKNKKKKATQSDDKHKTATATPGFVLDTSSLPFANLTSSSLWEQIEKEVLARFRYVIKKDTLKLRPLPVLRAFALKMGIQVLAKNYDFSSAFVFSPNDIVGLVPKVKQTLTKNEDARELLELAKAKLSNATEVSHVTFARDLMLDSVELYHQVFTPLHPEAIQAHSNLAMLLHKLGDREGALSHQQKAVVLAERVFGLDHPETIRIYVNLAFILHSFGRTSAALRFMQRARFLSCLIYGDSPHPEMITTETNTAFMLESLGDFERALDYYENVSKMQHRFLGDNNFQTAVGHRMLARTCGLLGNFKEGLAYEKHVYKTYLNIFGDKDPRTLESAAYLSSFTESAVKSAKGKQLQEAMRAIKAKQDGIVLPMPGDATAAPPSLPSVVLPPSASASSSSSSSTRSSATGPRHKRTLRRK